MTDELNDSAMLTGEPFKVGNDWFRCVIEKPGAVRLTWGMSDDWANWDPLDFIIKPASEIPDAILAHAQSHAEGDPICRS